MKFLKFIPALLIAFALVSAPMAKANDAQKAPEAAAKVEKAEGKAEKKECKDCKKGKKCKDCKKGKECSDCKKNAKCDHCASEGGDKDHVAHKHGEHPKDVHEEAKK